MRVLPRRQPPHGLGEHLPVPGLYGLPGAGQDGANIGRGDVTVGSDVWIGHAATVMSGVSIGHGAVIAARSLVTASVPPYGVVGGVPAKLLRYRFDEQTIAYLLEFAWWDWPREQVLANVEMLVPA
ncbi:MAG: CatB-related O-acetyltransferase [Actinobacteria bacterium]|nr:CatB-related O-acetyltransferase [Actinomycetota bacterium]MBW3646315.1 CatB-related O-acetyltransferase [Actinomycetota bacterium]